MDDLQPGDLTVEFDCLVAYTGEHNCAGGTIDSNGAHEPGCGYEPMIRLDDLSTIERIAVVFDPTAALGTPEVIYRREPGESESDAADRLRHEVTNKVQAAFLTIDDELLGKALRLAAAADSDEEAGRLLKERLVNNLAFPEDA